MRYSVLGGAVQVTVPASRHPIASRAWLARASALGAARTSLWARKAISRRSILAVMVGAAIVGAAVAGRDMRRRAVTLPPADVIAVDSQSLARAPASPAAAEAPKAPALANSPALPAESALSNLERPGYLLSSSAARALQDVRVAVADSALLQQLRAQISAPAVLPGLSGAALNDLVSLVRQAQVATSDADQAARASLDPVQLAQAQTVVKAAQQELLEATKARDQALLADPSASGVAGAPFIGAGSPTIAIAVARAGDGPVDPALIHDAQARLGEAQSRLRTLLAVPQPDAVAAAQHAVSAALLETPADPGPDRIAPAKAAVDNAQKAYDDAAQGPGSIVIAETLARPTPQTAPGRAALPPAADPAARSDGTVNRPVYGPDPQQVADTKANLDNAKAALAALEQQAAYASDPESRPAVIEARKHLSDLTAPPDPTAVADAQAIAITTQHQLDSMLGKTANVIIPSSQAPTTSRSPGPATSPSVAASATRTVIPARDPVALAAQHLTDAQKALRGLIVTSPDSASKAATEDSPANLPSGSTTTQVTPELRAVENRLQFGAGVSRNDLSVVEIDLRARYVLAAALENAHLHPSALATSPVDRLQRSGVMASHAFTWPVLGEITQPFGVPELGVGAPHTGVDIGAAIATPVLASASGIVSFAGGNPGAGYGYYAIVDHGGGVSTLYGHLALPAFLHPGQFLAQGGLVGLSGSTGFSTGPHLHFEVRLNSTPVDPLRVLSSSGSR